MSRTRAAKRTRGPDRRLAETAGPSRWVWGGVALGLVATLALVIWIRSGTNGLARRAPSEASPHAVEPIAVPTIDTEDVDHEVLQRIERDRQAILNDPESAAAWGTLGMTLFAHEFAYQAGICFEQAGKLAPQDARWPYLRGRTMLKSDPTGAVPFFERAVAIAGNTPPAIRLTLVDVLLELSRLDEADQHLAAMISERSGDPRARFAQARLASLRGDYQGCLSQLRELLPYFQGQTKYQNRLQPLLIMMAESLRRLGQEESAEKVRQQAMAQGEPSWPDPFQDAVDDRKTGLKTYLVQADLMYGRNQFDQSIELLKPTVQSYPDSIWAKILLARALIRTGAPDSDRPDRELRLQEAVELLEDVLQRDANSVEAMFRLGVAKEYQGKVQESIGLYRQAVQVKPDFTMAHFNLASALYREGDVDGAIQALQDVVRSQPEFVEGRSRLGVLLLQRRRFQEAEQQLDAAVQLRPDDARLRQYLGQARRGLTP